MLGFKKGFNTKAKEEAKILLYLARESTQSGLEKLIASELVCEWEQAFHQEVAAMPGARLFEFFHSHPRIP